MNDAGRTREQLLAEIEATRQRVVELEVEVAKIERSKERLRQRAAEREAMFRAFPDLSFRIGLDGTIVDFHAGRAADLYATPDQFLGKCVEDVLPADVARQHLQAIEKARGGEVTTLVYSLPLPDGEKVFEARLIPLPDGQIYDVVRDITERKQSEEALRESEMRYRAITETALDSIFCKDLDSRYTFVNGAMERLMGRPASELLGLTPRELFGEESGAVVEAVDAPVFLGEVSNAVRTLDIQGDEHVFHTIQVPLRGAAGEITGICGIVRDITDQKRAEDAVNRASRLEATATLAAGIAHDFNNLMVGVLGGAEMLGEDLRDSPEARDLLRTISLSAKKAGELAQQMLAFARGGKYVPVPLSLNDVLRETLRLQDRTFPPRVLLERDLDPELWNTVADKTQMTQVIMNLCINGVESIDGHGGIIMSTCNITVDEQFAEIHPGLALGRHVCLSVEDTGRGMDAKTRARVFEPFFSSKHQGRGLGMAAVHGIIRNHGGHISVYSAQGRGTTFKVYLPATDEECPGPSEPATEARTGAETILVIDDEQMVRDVTQLMLEQQGYRVLIASSGREALDVAEGFDGDIHLALLDMGMPVMGGSETYPELMRVRPDLKVIVCSGYGLDTAAQALLDAGASGFLQKPFQIRDLAREVRCAIDG